MQNNKIYSNAMLLPVIVAIALALRIVGITHGFPFIFHPDEPTAVRAALELRFYLNPGHFDWPHFYYYINFFIYMLFGKTRAIIMLAGFGPLIAERLPILLNEELIWYLISRILTALFGALTVIPIYLIGRETLGKRVGIIAALAFAVTPFHVRNSHFALIDVPMLFFFSWGIFYVVNLLKRSDTNFYSGAGFYLGLAASTKYNGALGLITIPLAHIFRVIKYREKLFSFSAVTNLSVSVFCSLVGFLMGTPYAALDYETFLRNDGPKGALWQFANVGSVFMHERIPKFFNQMFYTLSDDLGFVALAFFFVIPLVLIYRKHKKSVTEIDYLLWFLFTSGLIFLAYISGFDRSRSQYYFVAYPFIIVSFGYLLDLLLLKFSTKRMAIGLLIFMTAFGPSVFLSLKTSFSFYNTDTRVMLYSWLKNNLTPKDRLVYNKASITSVLERFDNRKSKKPEELRNYLPGYLILAYDDVCKCADFSVTPYGNRVNKLMDIEQGINLGPKISIYSLDK